MKKAFLFLNITFILIISCENIGHSYIPDWGPNNIKFAPVSGKAGDIVTITGENFFELENMELYKNDRQGFIDKFSNTNSLVYFNYQYSEKLSEDGKILEPILQGTEAIEFIEFDTNKIVCKVPEEAKSGRIWINGYYATFYDDFFHPSEEEFIVYDESGDIVR